MSNLQILAKHLQGRHNQSSHGRRGGSGGSGETSSSELQQFVGRPVKNGKNIPNAGKVIQALPDGHFIAMGKDRGTKVPALVTKKGTIIRDAGGLRAVDNKSLNGVVTIQQTTDNTKLWIVSVAGSLRAAVPAPKPASVIGNWIDQNHLEPTIHTLR